MRIELVRRAHAPMRLLGYWQDALSTSAQCSDHAAEGKCILFNNDVPPHTANSIFYREVGQSHQRTSQLVSKVLGNIPN